MFNIAVLASTRGTDLQAIIDAIKNKKLRNIKLACVISNKEHCLALKRAKKEGYKTYFVNPLGKIREEYDEEVAEILKHHEVDLIVLVGYMRILSNQFIKKYQNRVINVHPSLIPAFCGEKYFGKNVYEQALNRGVKLTGCTIHFVNEECDGGPIIFQKAVEIEDDDTTESLKAKVQEIEKKYYPRIIKLIGQGKIEMNENIVKIKKI